MDIDSETSPEPEGPPPKPYVLPPMMYRYNNRNAQQQQHADQEEDDDNHSLAMMSLDETNLTLLSSDEYHMYDGSYPLPPSYVLTSNHKQHQQFSEEDETFYEDRSLEERVRRSLSNQPARSSSVSAARQENVLQEHVVSNVEQPSEAADAPAEPGPRHRLALAQEQLSKLQHENQRLLQQLEQQKRASASRVNQTRNAPTMATPKHQSTDSSSNKDPPPSPTVIELARVTSQLQLLQETNAQLSKKNRSLLDELESTRDSMMEARTTAELREREANDRCRRLEVELQQARQREAALLSEERGDDLNALRDENMASKRKVQDLKKKLEEANNQVVELLSKKVGLEAQLADMKKSPTKSILRNHKGVQTDSKVTAVSTGTQTNATSKGSISSNTSLMMRRVDERMETYVTETLEHVTRALQNKSLSSDGVNMDDRLGRIRDAAERASNIQQHQRDLARLVQEHQAEIAKREQDFAAGKKQFIESTKVKFTNRCQELKQRLQAEFDGKMGELRRQHASEIKRLKEEAEGTSAMASESIQAAMRQASRQMELEVEKRNGLEARLQVIQNEHMDEKKAMADQYQRELQTLTHEWEEEKNRLLDFIRRECNSVFDRSKSTPGSSPKSVTSLLPFSSDEMTNTGGNASPFQPIQTKELGVTRDHMASPTSTLDLSQTLRETEAFVEMVLNGGSNE